MSTGKYKVFDDGGLQALVNQTKANKTMAADNSAAIEGLTTDLQGMNTQIVDVLGEVETCLNELDTVKADTATVNAALATKADKEHSHNYAGASSSGGAAIKAISDAAGNNIAETYVTKAELQAAIEQLRNIINSLNLGLANSEEDM